METCGFCVLNGRTANDKPANFTFINKNGKSVIDLILINLVGFEFKKDCTVEDFIVSTAHLPVTLTLKNINKFNEAKKEISKKKTHQRYTIKWEK